MPVSTGELLNLLREHALGADFFWSKGNLEARGCHRAQFRLSCPEHICDAFFNGVSGIRAHYYSGVEKGQSLTRLFVTELADQLLADARDKIDAAGTILAKVRASLAAESAKIWIDEQASTLDQNCVDAEVLIAIEVPHWLRAARQASIAITSGARARPRSKEKALLGVQVPNCCGIHIFGGWVADNDNHELLVPSKRNRARQIRVYGFS